MDLKFREFDQSRQRLIGAFFCVSLLLISSIDVFAIAPQISATPRPDVAAIVKQAKKHVKRGEFDEAEKAYINAIGLQPNDDSIKLELAIIYLKLKRLKEAYDIAFPIAKTDSTNATAYAVVGSALLGAGNFNESRPILDTALQLNKREALAWASLGLLEFYENNISDSLTYLREAVYRDDDEPDYIFALAQVASRSEKYKEAAAAYERFLRISPNTDNERRDRITGIINFLKYIEQKQSLYSIAGKDNTSVPIRLLNDRPIIEVQINGKDEKQNFVLDTGSGISVISEETAKRLGIDPVTKGGIGNGIGGDGTFDIVFGFVREIRIGDVEIRNIPVYIRKFHSRSEKVDGYIGLSLISKFLTTIDYGTKTFELEKAVAVDAAAEPSKDDDLTLPLRLTSSGFLSGEVILADHKEPFNFIVDTGATTTVISKEIMAKEAFRSMEQVGTTDVFGSAGVTYGIASYIVPELKFGPNIQNDVSAIALDLAIINQSSGYVQSGILGGNFLSKYKVTFDFQRSKVRFVPISTTAETRVSQ